MKFFDLFAGIGGFRVGLESHGHECVGSCEIDKYASLYVMMMAKNVVEILQTSIECIEAWVSVRNIGVKMPMLYGKNFV